MLKNNTVNKWVMFAIGLLIAIGVMVSEVTRMRHLTFIAYYDATINFWQGISSYNMDWVAEHWRYFLYAPPFLVLFTPFVCLPPLIAPFAWSIFNFTLLFFAIFSLPGFLSHRNKSLIFWISLPILAQSLLSCQYTVTIAAMFLFAISLLERGKPFWAVALIMVSGMTKVYGLIELGLLFCYPRLWRNMGYALLWGVALFFLPLVKLAPGELLPFYGEWLAMLQTHQTDTTWESIFYAQPFTTVLVNNMRALQISSLAILILLFFTSFRKWQVPQFRAQALGIIMCWVILFSDCAERNTYLVAVLGYTLWFFSQTWAVTRFDSVLLYLNFFLLCLVPIDVICPVPVMDLLHGTLSLHIYVFSITLCRMVWRTFMHPVTIKPSAERIVASPSDDIDIVCPCYKPSPSMVEDLHASITELRSWYPGHRLHLIVADDGSPSGFEPAVQQRLVNTIPDCEVAVIPHAGKGSAVRGGIALTKAPFVIYTDIDWPYKIDSMCKVIDEVLHGKDVVIGIRNQSYYSKLSPMRKLMTYGSKTLNHLFLNSPYTDTQGGLKGMNSRGRKQMLRTRINEFLFDTEFVAFCVQEGLHIVETETSLRDGIVMSKMSTKVLLRELKNFFKVAFSR